MCIDKHIEKDVKFNFYPNNIKSDVVTFAKNAVVLLDKNTLVEIEKIANEKQRLLKEIKDLKFY